MNSARRRRSGTARSEARHRTRWATPPNTLARPPETFASRSPDSSDGREYRGRRRLETVELLAEDVLRLLTSLLCTPLRLVGSALVFHALVAGCASSGLLGLAGDLLRHVLGLVDVAHVELLLRVGPTCVSL